MTAEVRAISNREHDPNRRLTKVFYIVIFLLVGTYYFERFVEVYLHNLVQRNQIGRWTLLVEYLDTGGALFFVLQMALVGWFCWSGKITIDLEPLTPKTSKISLRNTIYGLFSGLAVFLVGLPFLFALDLHTGFVKLLANEFFSSRTMFLVLLVGVVVPIASELVFRGIVFRVLAENVSLGAAHVANALLFAYVWRLFNPIVALLLGLTSALLYYRSRSIFPGIVANIVVTVSCTVALAERLLRHP